MAESNVSSQKRVMLWAPPRSLSTAFERCISVLNESINVDINHEMYTAACHLGPDRQIKIPYLFEPIVYEPKLTYKHVKRRLEGDYAGKDLVFCKELAYTVDGKLDMLPCGYRHTFLIRHPAKVFLSFQNFLNKFPNKLLRLELRTILPKGLVYQELFTLMKHTIDNLGQKPIVIDADDLMDNPEEVLRMYCKAIGIPFNQDMTRWRRCKKDLSEWTYSKRLMFVNKVMGQYDRAFSTPGLDPPPTDTDVDISCLPKKIRELVDISMPYYEQMYQYRLRSDDVDDASLQPVGTSASSSASSSASTSASSSASTSASSSASTSAAAACSTMAVEAQGASVGEASGNV
ncbi:uncharacterized protein [Diadema antillarum]|uniref:uncharacterized protein n=1 Tax=Diadema antillarum TaxID=105358 RepID=UPI003A89FDCE